MVVELATLGETLMPGLNALFGEHGATALALLEIIGINILLSGDNAVVIAIACRSLPPRKRAFGITLGVIVAIALRIVFTLGLQAVLHWPWLKLIGGLLLLWIAVQLLVEADDDTKAIADSKTLAGAVWTIALADVVMSLDNVLAIAGAARDKPWLIIFGLAMSIPLIAGGATLIITLLTRFPLLVWAGAALLGWIAGQLVAGEPLLAPNLAAIASTYGFSFDLWQLLGGVAFAVIVVLIGALAHARRIKPAAKL